MVGRLQSELSIMALVNLGSSSSLGYDAFSRAHTSILNFLTMGSSMSICNFTYTFVPPTGALAFKKGGHARRRLSENAGKKSFRYNVKLLFDTHTDIFKGEVLRLLYKICFR